MTTEARCGSDGRGDVLVTAGPASGRSIDVVSKSALLLEPGLRAVVAEALESYGIEDVAVRVEDYGALDHVIEARLETALRTLRPAMAAIRPTCVGRAPSERDRPRRSRLYAPGNNPRLLVGVELHGADCVLLDLEDSVPPGEKQAARILVKWQLADVEFPEETWVRINPLDVGGIDDLREVLLGRPHGVCLPKAESAADVRALVEQLERVESEYASDRLTWVMPIIETAKGVLAANEICAADPRVVVVAFGAEDYTRDVGARRTEESLLYARSRLVVAAKAAGIQASDTVFADLEDEGGLAVESRKARDLGFDGKGVINPRQLGAVHAAFSPTNEEVEAARAVVEAARQAEAEGLGAVSLHGKMVDKPVLERAERVIRYAEKLVGRRNRDA